MRKHKAKIEVELHKEVFEKLKDFGGLEELYSKYGVVDGELNLIVFDKFMLEQESTPDQQRFQIMNTNVAPLLATFGDKARVYSYSLKIKSEPKRDFQMLYNSLKSHILVKNEIPLRLYYDNYIIKGVWLDMSFQRQSNNDELFPVSFKFFRISETDTTRVGGLDEI